MRDDTGSAEASQVRDRRVCHRRAHAEAARAWRQSSDGLEARTLLLDALLLRGELGAQTGQLDAADDAINEALALTATLGPSGALAQARARLVRGELDSRRGDYEGATAAFAAAAEVRDMGSLGSGIAALATGRHAMVLLRSGDQSAARELALLGLARYKAASPTPDVERGIGRLETVLGHLANRDHDVDEAIAHYERARVRFERGGDRIGAAMAAVSMGNAAFVAGDLDAAEQRYREAVAACEAIEYVQGLTAARINLGNVLLDQGAADAALVELVAAETAMRRTEALDLLPEALRLIALCRLRAGNVAAALSAATEAVGIAREIGNVRLEDAATATLDEIEARAFAEPSQDLVQPSAGSR